MPVKWLNRLSDLVRGQKTRPEAQVTCTPAPSDASKAVERAIIAREEAEADQVEVRAASAFFRDQRKTNHFGPIIADGMRRGRES